MILCTHVQTSACVQMRMRVCAHAECARCVCACAFFRRRAQVVYQKGRTGFEENKDFPIEINDIVAGRCVRTA